MCFEDYPCPIFVRLVEFKDENFKENSFSNILSLFCVPHPKHTCCQTHFLCLLVTHHFYNIFDIMHKKFDNKICRSIWIFFKRTYGRIITFFSILLLNTFLWFVCQCGSDDAEYEGNKSWFLNRKIFMTLKWSEWRWGEVFEKFSGIRSVGLRKRIVTRILKAIRLQCPKSLPEIITTASIQKDSSTFLN